MAGRAQTGAIIEVLADLTAGGAAPTAGGALVIPTDWFHWLPLNALSLLRQARFGPEWEMGRAFIGRDAGDRVAAAVGDASWRDWLISRSGDHRAVRVGWLFVAGRVVRGGRTLSVFTPLVSCDAALHPAGQTLMATSTMELTPLIGAGPDRTRLRSAIALDPGDGIGGLMDPVVAKKVPRATQTFALEAATAAGLPATRVIPAGTAPSELMAADGLVVVAGIGVWSEKEATDLDRPGGLRSWSRAMTGTGIDRAPTAFEHLYLDELTVEDGAGRGGEAAPATPFVLDRAQQKVLDAARTQPLTVVSGSPGTGKSHLLVALACDALARGERVLVAAKSDDAVDALLHLLTRAPTPEPVVFGADDRRDVLAARLAAGQVDLAFDHEVAEARQALDAAIARRNAAESAMADELAAEQLLEGSGDTAGPVLRLGDPGVDLDEIEALLVTLTTTGAGPLHRHRHHQARERLAALTGAPADADQAALAEAIGGERRRRHAAALALEGGPQLGARWVELEEADAEIRRRAGAWLAADTRSRRRLDRHALPAVAALATALRSGRATRRRQLAGLDRTLTGALPLWIGSLPDIDDLLPTVADLFDVVLLDEASSIDQPLAAPALLRAGRAVIAGDPQQLRHVSFVSDEEIGSALRRRGLADDAVVAARLDVRRNSIFDVAAGAAPVIELDEHHRSVPHLVEWVADRLYGGRVRIATRSPRTADQRAIDVHRVDGRRDADRVVATEVALVRRRVRRLRDQGVRSLGVVSPFRAQADAIAAALDQDLSAADRRDLDLRVGTVHGFQGNERDVVIVSPGVGDGDDTARAWRFVDDPHLFAVLATRARSRMEVVIAGHPPANGLLAGWLNGAEATPVAPVSRDDAVTPWARRVAADLRRGGLDPVTAYPVGGEVIDLVVAGPGPYDPPVAIDARVHPDGVGAHIARHLALRRAGWDVHEVWPGDNDAPGVAPVVDLLVALSRK